MLIRHPDSARGSDLYETPEGATLALLSAEPLPPTIQKPACGRGANSKVLRSAGHSVVENDIDCGLVQDSVQDFLNFKPARAGEIDAIVTNPPYRLAQQFVRHGLTLCPRVFMLLRLTFYESERRKDVLESAGLICVHVFRNRLPMMHRVSIAPQILMPRSRSRAPRRRRSRVARGRSSEPASSDGEASHLEANQTNLPV